MANPSAALDVKQFDTPTYGDIMKERDAYRVQQNALAQQQLKQQQNAMLNQAYAEAYDPQTGRVDTNKLYGRLAQGGMGAEIPGQMEAYGKGVEATAKGSNEQFKFSQSILVAGHEAIANAATPQEAIAEGLRFAQQHPGVPALMDGVRRLSERIKDMTPDQFNAFKPVILQENLTAQQRLERDNQTVDTGAGGYVLDRSKYSNDPYTIVPGSQYQKTMTPQQQYEVEHPTLQHVEGADGIYSFNTKTGGAAPVMVGGGGIPDGRGDATLSIVRKNNPAAMEYHPWMAKYGATKEGRFARFPSVEANVAAQEALLKSRVGQGTNTINAIVNSYTPASRENPEANRNSYKQYIAQQTGIDINSPISAAQVPAVAKAMREFETGQRPGAAPAAGAGQLKGPAKGGGKAAQQQQVATEKAKERSSAAQALYDIIAEAGRKGHLVSEKQSYAANRAQELLTGRPYLPGGTAQKTSQDKLQAAAAQLARSFVQEGTSGTMNAVAEMDLFLKTVGGGTATYEARMETLRNFAKQHGIQLNDYADREPQARGGGEGAAGGAGRPPAGVTAEEWQYMTPEERAHWGR